MFQSLLTKQTLPFSSLLQVSNEPVISDLHSELSSEGGGATPDYPSQSEGIFPF